MNYPVCVCGAQEFDLFLEGDYYCKLVGDETVHFQVLRCQQCDVLVTNPMPSLEDSLYNKEEEKRRNELWIANYNNYRAGRLKSYLFVSTKSLEIGCSEGDFLSKLEEIGIQESIGVEIDRGSAAKGRACGRDIRTTKLHECRFPENYFDIVQAHHVLEHIYELHDTLAEIHRITKPNGIFYVTVPRHNSVFVKKSPSWMGWYPQRHIWHFTEKTLVAILKEHGFEPINVSCIRGQNYFPIQMISSHDGLLKPLKLLIKRTRKLATDSAVKYLALGDIIDALFRAV